MGKKKKKRPKETGVFCLQLELYSVLLQQAVRRLEDVCSVPSGKGHTASSPERTPWHAFVVGDREDGMV